MNREVTAIQHFPDITDSTWKKNLAKSIKPDSMDKLLPDSARFTVYEAAINAASFMKNSIQNNQAEIECQKK